jgi:hypothetical protein
MAYYLFEETEVMTEKVRADFNKIFSFIQPYVTDKEIP